MMQQPCFDWQGLREQNVADNLNNCWKERTGLRSCWICVVFFGRNALCIQRWNKVRGAVSGKAFYYLPNFLEISGGR